MEIYKDLCKKIYEHLKGDSYLSIDYEIWHKGEKLEIGGLSEGSELYSEIEDFVESHAAEILEGADHANVRFEIKDEELVISRDSYVDSEFAKMYGSCDDQSINDSLGCTAQKVVASFIEKKYKKGDICREYLEVSVQSTSESIDCTYYPDGDTEKKGEYFSFTKREIKEINEEIVESMREEMDAYLDYYFIQARCCDDFEVDGSWTRTETIEVSCID